MELRIIYGCKTLLIRTNKNKIGQQKLNKQCDICTNKCSIRLKFNRIQEFIVVSLTHRISFFPLSQSEKKISLIIKI